MLAAWPVVPLSPASAGDNFHNNFSDVLENELSIARKGDIGMCIDERVGQFVETNELSTARKRGFGRDPPPNSAWLRFNVFYLFLFFLFARGRSRQCPVQTRRYLKRDGEKHNFQNNFQMYSKVEHK